QKCEPPLNRKAFLSNPVYGPELRKIRAAHKHLFYDRDLNLNQGFYLTPAPAELVSLLNSACQETIGHPLPHLEALETPSQLTVPPSDEPPVIDHQQRVWLYAPGRDAEHWDEFYRDGIIGIGWNKLGDLSKYQDPNEVADKIREVYERENNP